MIRHIMRMVWNRKRSTSLLLVELLVSFLVLCVLFSGAAYYAINWKKPLGYDWRNVLNLVAAVPPVEQSDVEGQALRMAESARLMDVIRAQPEVLGVSPAYNTPYSGSMSRTGMRAKDGGLVQYMVSHVTPDLKDVLALELVQGRWLEPADQHSPWTPVVITRKLATRLFGNEDPIGRTIDSYDEDGTLEVAENEFEVRKVVGVISDYRKMGEFSDSPYAAFSPMYLDDSRRSSLSQEYLIRVAPGTPPAFEERLLRTLQAAAPDYSTRLTPLESTRRDYIKSRLMPLIVLAVVAWFLILMVGMGLVGVLWQNVAQRSREFGLRRALGATGGDVVRQVVGEMLALTTLAVLAGTILFLQVPMLRLPGFINIQTALTAIGASIVVLYPFVGLCSLYPSWLASTVQPVEALHSD
jgi:putative ABC transport system permease protein